jgi:hypothetical protein
LDHDDVTWDSSKGENFEEQKERGEDEKKEFKRKVGGSRGTWCREPQTLF